MSLINQLFRFATGVLFIFSGLVKLNDPVGTQIKLEEYFEVFSTDFASFFHYLIPLALPLAVVLCVAEVILGVALLLQYRMRLTMWALLLLISFFTFLTFYSAYFNKVTDCGCFGDAIPLDPWESFTKDVVLLIMIVVLFVQRNRLRPALPSRAAQVVVGGATVLSLALALYAINYLPPIDFRPYKIGNNLPQLMESSAPLQYQYVMVKNGKEEVFDQYPTDTTYKYKDMILINPEALPKITDYQVWNDQGDFTQETFQGKKLLIVVQNLEHTDVESYTKINQLVGGLPADVKPMVITSVNPEAFEIFRHEVQLALPYYFADATVLKAMIRSNPGLMLLEDGVVRGKWHYHTIPSPDELTAQL
ncbi:DoxX protein [Catalinimonas alkaloidigena]|uniref:DoxX protein n=1 Tax=Catalinimonas alkaloidigena TaxID=1075417 RepID=A0A1G9MUU3_9BACT|nr:BT_3928 family protein [Catalinimonas alkaloidigena]SDL77989.1 DoxX protein [Catalinimonas alkaloidigena]